MLASVRRAGGGHFKKLAEAARLWASGSFADDHDVIDSPPVKDALAAFGLYAVRPDEPVKPPEFHLWPENLDAWLLFHAVQTQWRVGVSGAQGLDYGGVHAVIGQRRAWRLHRRRRFAEIQVMERACLAVWAERRAGQKVIGDE